jgi:hypothetical protein
MSAIASRLLGRACGLAMAAACVAAPAAQAQPRLEVTASGAWWDGYALGERRAAITGPQAPTGAPVTLFDADLAVRPGSGGEVRLGWRVLRGLYAEATGGIVQSSVEARVRNDIESAPALTIASTLTQFSVEGGALVEAATLRLPAGQLVVFGTGGGGYLRQVHGDRILIETGRLIYGGAGVKWRAATNRPRGLLQRVMVRGDARLVSRTGGVDIEEGRRRNYITVSAGVGVRLF